jgi:hypothetical protein
MLSKDQHMGGGWEKLDAQPKPTCPHGKSPDVCCLRCNSWSAPASLPEDAIEAACAVYHDEIHGERGSWQDLKPKLKPAFREAMEAALRNFAQRPDVLGEPNEDDEGYAYSAGAALRPYQIVCNFLKQRRTRLFAPKEPSLEQELNEICSYAATIEESPRETSRKILSLIQRQQGKGKE